MRAPNNNNNNGPQGTIRRFAAPALLVALLLCGVAVGWLALPQAGCNAHFIHAAARNISSRVAATLGPVAALATSAATSSSSAASGLAMFAPLLPQLLHLTNFSQVPSASVIDGALTLGTDPQRLRAMMQLQQQLHCEGGYDKVPWPGTVGVRFHNVTVYVYGANDIVSSNLATTHGWEAAEIQEWLWAIRQWKPQALAGKAAAAASLGGAAASSNPYRNRPLAVDVGANLGWFTLNAAAAGARVAAFEAMPSNIGLIRRSLCGSPWLAEHTALYGVGLAEKSSECYIISGDGNRGDGFTICDRHRAQNTPGYQMRGVINLRRLDTLLQEDVQVMKIDVEGYEQKVLEGAQALLASRRVRHIMAECNTGIIGEEAGRAFIRFLDSRGFEVSPKSFQGPFWSAAEVRNRNASCSNINLYARLRPEA